MRARSNVAEDFWLSPLQSTQRVSRASSTTLRTFLTASFYPAHNEQGQLDLIKGPPDEIRVKARGMVVWMGLAMMVSTRLWLGGVVSRTRDTSLAEQLLQQVRACSQAACARLFYTDGWAASPNSIRRAIRSKVKRTAERGRASLQVWSGLHIGTVIKQTVNKRLTEVVRQMSHGSMVQAVQLLQRSKGGLVLNTSSIERLNGTVRERLATLTRKYRHAAHRLQALETGMYLIGSTYTFCCFHHELSQRTAGVVQGPLRQTPAMASGLTDHLWSLSELLQYKVAPAPWVEPEKACRRSGAGCWHVSTPAQLACQCLVDEKIRFAIELGLSWQMPTPWAFAQSFQVAMTGEPSLPLQL